ncbi:TetR/AcrR family transcriptional regulator [Maritalea sp.]|uniref:TetR/AcrR family transcriptional regulator n=1 Tax=Maritalea sp. TaxID=2003361 RepID=UPI003EFA6088
MTAQKQDLKPRKKPVQGRSKAVVDAILQASIRVLDREGYSAFNTNRVAEIAGVSVGSVYQYFPSKEAILMTILRQKRQNLLDKFNIVATADNGDDLTSAVTRLVGATIEAQGDWPRLAKVLALAEHDLPVEQSGRGLKIEIADSLTNVLAHYGIEQPKVAALDIMAIVDALIHSAQSTRKDANAHLQRNIVNAVMGYLQV